MSLTPGVAAGANIAIAFCFFTIAGLIFAGLWRERRTGLNPLGVATGFIFFTCASGHAMHAEHYILFPETFNAALGADLWHQAALDLLTIVPAVAYLAQRRRFGLVVRGQHALLDFERRFTVAEALRSIGEDIAAQTDLSEVLRRLTHHARVLLGADYTVVLVCDQQGRQRCEAAGIKPKWDAEAWRAAVFLTRAGTAGATLHARQPVVAGDLLAVRTAARREYAIHIAEGARAILAVPITRGGEVIGSLVAAYRATRTLGEDDLERAAALAGQAGVAVENTRLIEGLREAVHARDEFFSVAAHELKTPVTSLRGFAQLAISHLDKGGSPDSGQLRRGLQIIDQQSEKLALLMARLLDVSRIEAGRLALECRETDVGALARGVVDSAQLTTTQHRLRLHVEGPCLALVDPLRVEQVIRNLVDNALKYSPHGGSVEVDVWQPDPDTVRLTVTDHGVGIPAEQRAHVFDRFYRVADYDRTSGMGLGLYVSQQIIELHHGKIEVEAPIGGGTRFVVTLPARACAADEAGREEEAAWNEP